MSDDAVTNFPRKKQKTGKFRVEQTLRRIIISRIPREN